jgi:hypothetical protein
MISFYDTKSTVQNSLEDFREISKLSSDKLKVLNLSFSSFNSDNENTPSSKILSGFQNLEVKKNFISIF